MGLGVRRQGSKDLEEAPRGSIPSIKGLVLKGKDVQSIGMIDSLSMNDENITKTVKITYQK